MIKKISYSILLVIFMILLSGCEMEMAFVKDPLSKKDVIKHVQKEIYNEFGDEVTVKIVSQDDLMVCTYVWDECDTPNQKVRGGTSYKLEIRDNKNREVVATGTYNDGYVAYGTKYYGIRNVQSSSFTSNYAEKKGMLKIKDDFVVALKNKFNKYYVYMDISNNDNYDIFVSSSSYDDINYLITEFNKVAIKYKPTVRITYSIYIYKDEEIFNSIDFDSYDGKKESSGIKMIEQFTIKEATKIGYSNIFNYDLFTTNGASAASYDEQYIDYTTFDYIVFWYYSGNSPYQSGDLPEMHIFGIK